MYRRYYRYNDPMPTNAMRRGVTAPTPPTTAAPKQQKLPAFTDKLFQFAEKDDLILIGLLLLVLMEENKKEIDFPMVLALLYLLLQK